MRTMLKLAIAAGALWAVWAFVPIGGRTLDARWRAAPTAQAFAQRSWRELTSRLAGRPSGAGAPQARPEAPGPDRRSTRDGRPVESHSQSDRREVDRLVADGLRR
jgi:hypothetical protein